MFRWAVELTPLSLGSHGHAREATLEVTPRGASFTLAALSHVGHPSHLAVIDAYLKGQVRLTPTATIGEDSRLVASSVAGPLLVAFELGVERLSLADLVLRPYEQRSSHRADRAADGQPCYTADSPRFLLRANDVWHSVRAAERFEVPGCSSTQQGYWGDQSHQVIAQLPSSDEIAARARADRRPAPILAEVRASTGEVGRADAHLVGSPRAEARGQPRRVSVLGRPSGLPPALARLPELLAALAGPIQERRPLTTSLLWRGLAVDVRLEPDPDGYGTLSLLPAAEVEPAGLFEPMRELAWATIEALIGRALPEQRTEPIALRLAAEDGRSTTLDIGASVVIGRNQTVFAAWVGSDGRVMVRLLPPGGMPTR
jgi:hypothetical protein